MLVCDYLTHAKAMILWISLQNVISVMLMNVRSKFRPIMKNSMPQCEISVSDNKC